MTNIQLEWALILLPVAFLVGWLMAKRRSKKTRRQLRFSRAAACQLFARALPLPLPIRFGNRGGGTVCLLPTLPDLCSFRFRPVRIDHCRRQLAAGNLSARRDLTNASSVWSERYIHLAAAFRPGLYVRADPALRTGAATDQLKSRRCNRIA